MSRELDVNYKKLCSACKAELLKCNRDMLKRMTQKYSFRVMAELTGIPKSTLWVFLAGRKSELKYFRTSQNRKQESKNTEKIEVDITELSKRIKELGQNEGV